MHISINEILEMFFYLLKTLKM